MAERRQCDVHTAIAGQPDDRNSGQSPLPLFRRDVRIFLDRVLHFLGRQVSLLSVSLGINSGSRNTLFDQEALDPSHTTFGERLVEGWSSALIRVTFQREVSVRLGFKIFLEISRHRHQDLLLRGQQARVRILGRGLRRLEIHTVQSKPPFEMPCQLAEVAGFQP